MTGDLAQLSARAKARGVWAVHISFLFIPGRDGLGHPPTSPRSEAHCLKAPFATRSHHIANIDGARPEKQSNASHAERAKASRWKDRNRYRGRRWNRPRRRAALCRGGCSRPGGGHQ